MINDNVRPPKAAYEAAYWHPSIDSLLGIYGQLTQHPPKAAYEAAYWHPSIDSLLGIYGLLT